MPWKIFSIPLAKFLTTFIVVHLHFSLFSHQLSNFTRIRSLDAPPSVASCPSNDIFTSFLVIYLHFIKKTGPLDAPQGGCPGPSHRPHPPLHATAWLRMRIANAELAYYFHEFSFAHRFLVT